MPYFHLRSAPGTVWPPVPAPEVSQLWSAYQTLDRTQWLSPAELEEFQLQQLRALLLHCFHQVPYYRRLLAQSGLSSRPIQSLADYRRLPLLTRELYQAHFTELQARGLPAGITAAGSGHTSGTSGVPIQVLKTNRDGLWWSALYLRDLQWNGFDPRGRLAAIRLMAMSDEELPQAMEGFSCEAWSPFCPLLLEAGPSYGMDIRQWCLFTYWSQFDYKISTIPFV